METKEYLMNVLSFQIQTLDIMPALPYQAPFSSSVPDICIFVRSIIEDSVQFFSHGPGQIEIFPTVKKYLDRMLLEGVEGPILRLVEFGGLDWSQMLQVEANITVMERACEFFLLHAAQLSGVGHTIGRMDFAFRRTHDATKNQLIKLSCTKIDCFMAATDFIKLIADDSLPVSDCANDYANGVPSFLQTFRLMAQQVLRVPVLHRVLLAALHHVSDHFVGFFLSDTCQRFNKNAVMKIVSGLRLFENFGAELDELTGEDPKRALIKARQLISLLISENPENFFIPGAAARSSSARGTACNSTGSPVTTAAAAVRASTVESRANRPRQRLQ